MPKIIVYTKTGCPWCLEVLNFLKESKIDFEERNVTENPEFFKEMKEKSKQEKAPTIEINGDILPDSDVNELKNYLKKRGNLYGKIKEY